MALLESYMPHRQTGAEMDYEKRPNPDELLSRIMKKHSGRGRFKIFFGMSPGVGMEMDASLRK
jgi:hypothetical protein